jgi:transposase
LADRCYARDGTWDKVLASLLTRADTADLITWEVSADSTVNRAHQHGSNLKFNGTAGGRPVSYDREAYKRRNVVKPSFNTLKQWRSLVTRYDKLAPTYRSAAVLQAVVIWSAALVLGTP